MMNLSGRLPPQIALSSHGGSKRWLDVRCDMTSLRLLPRRYLYRAPRNRPMPVASTGPKVTRPNSIDPPMSPDGGGPLEIPKPFRSGIRIAISKIFAAMAPTVPHNQMRQAKGRKPLQAEPSDVAKVATAPAAAKAVTMRREKPNGKTLPADV